MAGYALGSGLGLGLGLGGYHLLGQVTVDAPIGTQYPTQPFKLTSVVGADVGNLVSYWIDDHDLMRVEDRGYRE